MTYPLDLMRARLAVHLAERPKYPSYMAAFQQSIRTEGCRSLFNGLTPTLIGIVPYAGLSFMLFESSKTCLTQMMNGVSESEIPVAYRVTLGGVSGLIAQSATYPLDIIRRRMQVHSNKERYQSMFRSFKTIYETEGVVNGLYKGLCMNWFKGPLAVGISFTVNDLIKNYFISNKETLHTS